MLGIEPHIAIADIAVGGGDMGLFVESRRFLSRDEQRDDAVESEESEEYPGGVPFHEMHRIRVIIFSRDQMGL